MAYTDANADTFQAEVLDATELVLVDFWAPWCGPCRMLGPIVEEAAEDKKYAGKLKVVKINVDENQELAQQHDVSSIPSVKFFQGGKQVDEFIGVRERDELDEIIDGLLEKGEQE